MYNRPTGDQSTATPGQIDVELVGMGGQPLEAARSPANRCRQAQWKGKATSRSRTRDGSDHGESRAQPHGVRRPFTQNSS